MNLLRDEPGRVHGTMWGGTLYELQPGEHMSDYHWHVAEEECLLVVAGTPTLRTPEGERTLQPWDMAAFVCGEAGAHQVRNESSEPARVVMFSMISDPEIVVYPDTGKVGAVSDGMKITGWVVPR